MQHKLDSWLVDPGETTTNTDIRNSTHSLTGHSSARDQRRGSANVKSRRPLDVSFISFNCQYLNIDYLHSIVRTMETHSILSAALTYLYVRVYGIFSYAAVARHHRRLPRHLRLHREACRGSGGMPT